MVNKPMSEFLEKSIPEILASSTLIVDEPGLKIYKEPITGDYLRLKCCPTCEHADHPDFIQYETLEEARNYSSITFYCDRHFVEEIWLKFRIWELIDEIANTSITQIIKEMHETLSTPFKVTEDEVTKLKSLSVEANTIIKNLSDEDCSKIRNAI